MEKASSRLKVLALLVALMFVALSHAAVVPAGPRRDRSSSKQRPRQQRAASTYLRPPPRRDLRRQGQAAGREPAAASRSGSTATQLGDQTARPSSPASPAADMDVRVASSSACRTTRYYSFQPIPVAEFVPKTWRLLHLGASRVCSRASRSCRRRSAQYPDGTAGGAHARLRRA